MIKYLFADRDGTLILDKHYLSDPAQVELFSGVSNSLKLLRDNDIKIFVVTNQSGIGRGYFSENDFFACQEKLKLLLLEEGAEISDYAFCPHAPEEECSCRKPSLGMWEYLSQKHGIFADECAMVGDKMEDVVFGIKAGFALSCLVLTGKGEQTARKFHLQKKGEPTEFSSELFGIKQEKTKCYLVSTLSSLSDFIIKDSRD